MDKIKNNVDNWNPYFIKYKDGEEIIIYYEKSWYCNQTKTIHKNSNQYINCKYCNTDLDREKYFDKDK